MKDPDLSYNKIKEIIEKIIETNGSLRGLSYDDDEQEIYFFEDVDLNCILFFIDVDGDICMIYNFTNEELNTVYDIIDFNKEKMEMITYYSVFNERMICELTLLEASVDGIENHTVYDDRIYRYNERDELVENWKNNTLIFMDMI